MLLGSLYLQRGSPSKSSGPIWDILESFIKNYYLSASRDLPPNEQKNLDTEPQNPLKNFVQKVQNQKKLLYFVKLQSFAPLNDDQINAQIAEVRRIFPEESQIFCPGPQVLIALFSSTFPVDQDLYLTIFNRNLIQNSHPRIWKELKFGVLQNGMTIEDLFNA